MAEFLETLHHMRRMCAAHMQCYGCPIKASCCGGYCVPFVDGYQTLKEIERNVLEWAEDHPEESSEVAKEDDHDPEEKPINLRDLERRVRVLEDLTDPLKYSSKVFITGHLNPKTIDDLGPIFL